MFISLLNACLSCILTVFHLFIIGIFTWILLLMVRTPPKYFNIVTNQTCSQRLVHTHPTNISSLLYWKPLFFAWQRQDISTVWLLSIITLQLPNNNAQSRTPCIAFDSSALGVMSETRTYSRHPNVCKWALDGFTPVNSSLRVFSCCGRPTRLRVSHSAYRHFAHM